MPRDPLHELADQLEENVERVGELHSRIRGLLDELLRIDDDEQQLLGDLEARPGEEDRVTLQLEARDLHERRKQLSEEISHGRNDFEKLRAENASLKTRFDKEFRAATIESQKMFFEIAKHLTTLNTAAILVYLVAGEQVSLPLWVALAFAASLAGATLSMVVTGLRGINTTSPWALGNFGMAVAVAGFFVGLLYSVLHALLLP